MIRLTVLAALTAVLVGQTAARAESINAGNRGPSLDRPFKADEVAEFNTPWAIAFLPDGGMLVTEKPGHIFLVTQAGRKTPVDGVPAVEAIQQNGLLDIAPAPDFASSSLVYFTYVAPGASGSRLLLDRATLSVDGDHAMLKDRTTIWRQTPPGGRGQPGGIIAFDPEGKHLFLTVGDRQQPETAQDPKQARGKLLRLNLDGSTPSDNPQAAEGGVLGETWTTGHRNPYGLAFAPDGKLWLHEMGPMGGDEQLLQLAGPYAQQALTQTILAFKNTLDWLTGDTDLLAVSAKILQEPGLVYGDVSKPKFDADETEEQLKKRDEEMKQARKGTQNAVAWILSLGIPLLFALYGVARWRIRETTRANVSLA